MMALLMNGKKVTSHCSYQSMGGQSSQRNLSSHLSICLRHLSAPSCMLTQFFLSFFLNSSNFNLFAREYLFIVIIIVNKLDLSMVRSWRQSVNLIVLEFNGDIEK